MLPLGLMLLFQIFAPSTDETGPAAGMAFAAFIVVYVIILVIAVAISIFINWRIAVKSGYPGAYSLLMLIPLVNVVILIIWVFSEWPIETELKRVRMHAGLPPGAPVGAALGPSGGSSITSP